MSQAGFSLVDTVVTVAIVGVLATIAVPKYQTNIAKSQISEALSLIAAEKTLVAQHILKNNECGTSSALPIQAKYGLISVSGTLKNDAIQYSNTLQNTGCVITYSFGNGGVSKLISGKKINADLFNNSTLSKSTSTTVSDALLPPTFTTLSEDEVTKASIGDADEIYIAKDPDLDSDSTGDDGTGTYKLNISKDYLNLTAVDSSYYVKPSVNLYDFFVSRASRTPKDNENIEITVDEGVAVLGYTDVGSRSNASGALIVDNRWPKVNLTIVNHGLVAGYGSRGGYNNGGTFNTAYSGGTALVNTSDQTIYAINHGILSGGGGGGQISFYGGAGWTSAGGGGGAPYGRGGEGNKGTVGGTAGLLYGGDGYTFKGGATSGAGGALGNGGAYALRNNAGNWKPGNAGATFSGSVILTNMGEGKNKL